MATPLFQTGDIILVIPSSTDDVSSMQGNNNNNNNNNNKSTRDISRLWRGVVVGMSQSDKHRDKGVIMVKRERRKDYNNESEDLKRDNNNNYIGESDEAGGGNNNNNSVAIGLPAGVVLVPITDCRLWMKRDKAFLSSRRDNNYNYKGISIDNRNKTPYSDRYVRIDEYNSSSSSNTMIGNLSNKKYNNDNNNNNNEVGDTNVNCDELAMASQSIATHNLLELPVPSPESAHLFTVVRDRYLYGGSRDIINYGSSFLQRGNNNGRVCYPFTSLGANSLVYINPYNRRIYSKNNNKIKENIGEKSSSVSVDSEPPSPETISKNAIKLLFPLRSHSTTNNIIAVNSRTTDNVKRAAIVVTGVSGAGKTMAMGCVLDAILHQCSGDVRCENRQDNGDNNNNNSSSLLLKRLMDASAALEAFGNAPTINNTNSSRFVKSVSIFLQEQNVMIGECDTKTASLLNKEGTNFIGKKIREVNDDGYEEAPVPLSSDMIPHPISSGDDHLSQSHPYNEGNNNNSSNQQKFNILGISVDATLLELTRVNSFRGACSASYSSISSSDEGNGPFHIFSLMFSSPSDTGGIGVAGGLPIELRKDWVLWDPSHFHCLTGDHNNNNNKTVTYSSNTPHASSVYQRRVAKCPWSLEQVTSSLISIGFSKEEIYDVLYKTIAVILHLGNIEFQAVSDFSPASVIKTSDSGNSSRSNTPSLDVAARLLGLGRQPIGQQSAGSSYVATSSHILTAGQELEKLLTTVDIGGTVKQLHKGAATMTRDTLCRALYQSIFDCILERLNRPYSRAASASNTKSRSTVAANETDSINKSGSMNPSDVVKTPPLSTSGTGISSIIARAQSAARGARAVSKALGLATSQGCVSDKSDMAAAGDLSVGEGADNIKMRLLGEYSSKAYSGPTLAQKLTMAAEATAGKEGRHLMIAENGEMSLEEVEVTRSSCGVGPIKELFLLDIFGFETIQTGVGGKGDSEMVNDLEQLLINYTNEEVQLAYLRTTLEKLAIELSSEGIVLDRKSNQNESTTSNSRDGSRLSDAEGSLSVIKKDSIVVDAFTRKGTNPSGLFKILSDDGQLAQQRNDKGASLISKIVDNFRVDPQKQRSGSITDNDVASLSQYSVISRPALLFENQFNVQHYCGVVTYTGTNFSIKNRIISSIFNKVVAKAVSQRKIDKALSEAKDGQGSSNEEQVVACNVGGAWLESLQHSSDCLEQHRQSLRKFMENNQGQQRGSSTTGGLGAIMSRASPSDKSRHSSLSNAPNRSYAVTFQCEVQQIMEKLYSISAEGLDSEGYNGDSSNISSKDNIFWIRCIKPVNVSPNVPGLVSNEVCQFDDWYVSYQLATSGVYRSFEFLCREGYPVRVPHQQFCIRHIIPRMCAITWKGTKNNKMFYFLSCDMKCEDIEKLWELARCCRFSELAKLFLTHTTNDNNNSVMEAPKEEYPLIESSPAMVVGISKVFLSNIAFVGLHNGTSTILVRACTVIQATGRAFLKRRGPLQEKYKRFQKAKIIAAGVQKMKEQEPIRAILEKERASLFKRDASERDEIFKEGIVPSIFRSAKVQAKMKSTTERISRELDRAFRELSDLENRRKTEEKAVREAFLKEQKILQIQMNEKRRILTYSKEMQDKQKEQRRYHSKGDSERKDTSTLPKEREEEIVKDLHEKHVMKASAEKAASLALVKELRSIADKKATKTVKQHVASSLQRFEKNEGASMRNQVIMDITEEILMENTVKDNYRKMEEIRRLQDLGRRRVQTAKDAVEHRRQSHSNKDIMNKLSMGGFGTGEDDGMERGTRSHANSRCGSMDFSLSKRDRFPLEIPAKITYTKEQYMSQHADECMSALARVEESYSNTIKKHQMRLHKYNTTNITGSSDPSRHSAPCSNGATSAGHIIDKNGISYETLIPPNRVSEGNTTAGSGRVRDRSIDSIKTVMAAVSAKIVTNDIRRDRWESQKELWALSMEP